MIAAAAPAWVTTRRLRWALRVIIVAAAATQAWRAREFMVPDAISYLDLGDAFFRGDWRAALSTYWSPAYSVLLGLVMAVVRPGPHLEWTVAHAGQLLTLLLALGAFELLMNALLEGLKAADRPTMGELLVVFSGYTLFAGTSLTMGSVSFVTADQLVAATSFVLAACVERMRVRGATPARAAALGALAGAAPLAKAVMLPVGALFALASWTVLGRGRARVLHAAGLRDGDRVAYVGRSYRAASWARLARLRIVAEVPDDEAPKFWKVDEDARERVVAAFRSAGARVVLTTGAAPAPWVELGDTNVYYRWLDGGATAGAGQDDSR